MWTDDPAHVLGVTYGATDGSGAYYSRVTRLLGPDGDLALEYEVRGLGTHPLDVLDDCKRLYGK